MIEEKPIKSYQTDIELPEKFPAHRTITFLKQFLLLSTSGITLTILIILIGIWRTGNRISAGIEAFFNPSSSRRVDVPTLVVDRVRGVSELTTAVFVMEAVVPTSEERKLGEIVFASTKLLYVAYGEVRAGVDLSKIAAEDIEIVNNTIKIKLPPPRILDSKIDVRRSRVYSYSRGFLSLGPDVASELQTLAQRQTLEKIVATACDRGLLEDANRRAEIAVTNLLNTSGYIKVEVKTTPPSSQACNSALTEVRDRKSEVTINYQQ